MMKMLSAVIALLLFQSSHGQLLTWTPPFPAENDPTQTLVITTDASKGNRGLFNHTPTEDVYVHIGVITSKSTSPTNWKYVKFTWGSNTPAARATYVGSNKWQFTITGSLRTYFGITDATETIQKIAILFRNGSGSKQQENSDNSDMYVPVYSSGLHARIEQPYREPRYVPVVEQTYAPGANITVEGKASAVANLTLYHNNSVIATANGTQTITTSVTITNSGGQQFILRADDGSIVKYDTLYFFVNPSSSVVAPLPASVRDGINYEPGDTSVILVLHAPGKNFVSVLGDFNNWTEDTSFLMRKTPDGNKFWLRLTGLTPGMEYAFQYKVDDTIRIADPYTEKVLDPWNDPYISPSTYPGLKPYPAGQTGIVSILQTAAPTYSWSANFSRPDKKNLVIYEMLLRDFIANHDWKTLKDTISYLKRLGVNAIQLMPVNEFEGNDSWGYNPSFYFAPDKYYGPANTMKEFIDSCHKNGIAVIMDIALNHSFGSSPLVQLYFDKQNNRPAANNPWFNPVPKHAYNVGYDMNHQSAATQYFTVRVMEHWVKNYRIDGFRFDLSKGFTQVQTCDNNGLNCNEGAMAAYDASRIALWKKYYDSLQAKSAGAYGILEHFADNNEEKELTNYGMLVWGNLNYNYSEAAMGFVSNSNFQWGIYSSRGWTYPHLVTYMESHDEERITYRLLNYGNSSGSYNTRDTATALERMELDAAFLFTIPGPKMIWQFGELGYDFAINRCTDGSINNNCRLAPKPIRWDYYNDPRRRQVYDTYSKLINLRYHPTYRLVMANGPITHSLASAFKWMRIGADSAQIMVIGNFGLTAQTGGVTFPTAGTWYGYLDSSSFSATGSLQAVTLQPGEFRVYLNKNVHNISTTPVTNILMGGQALTVNLFPNPVTNGFNCQMTVPSGGYLSVDLLNATGQVVKKITSSFAAKGSRQLFVSREGLPSGTYFLRVSHKNQSELLPLLFQ